jgi:hypothetical protein
MGMERARRVGRGARKIFEMGARSRLRDTGLYSDGGNKKGWNKNRSRKESNKI